MPQQCLQNGPQVHILDPSTNPTVKTKEIKWEFMRGQLKQKKNIDVYQARRQKNFPTEAQF